MKQRWEEFKKNAIKAFILFQDRLEESSLYNLLKERYQALPYLKQKIIKYIVILSQNGISSIPLRITFLFQ